MPINFERLDAAITYAAEHPAEFDMGMWFERGAACGTTACLAGTTIALEGGWTPVWESFAEVNLEQAFMVEREGKREYVADVAAGLLGLDGPHRIMFALPNLRSVIRYRNELAAKAGVPERTWTTP